VLLLAIVLPNLTKPKDGEQANVTTTEAITTTAEAMTTPATTTIGIGTTDASSSTTTTAAVSAATTTAIATTSAPATTTTVAATTAPITTVVPGQAGASGPVSEQVQNLLKAGRQSVAAGDFKTALTAINDALKLDSRNVVANLELGMVYLKAPNDQAVGNVNRADEALKAFKKVTDQAPTWAAGWARLGDAQAVKGDIPGAIKSYVRSMELDANGAERWLVLAGLYERNNQTAEATYARQRAQGIK
jgi:cytochrome c-type biogenesis protein CcmH/NrfG